MSWREYNLMNQMHGEIVKNNNFVLRESLLAQLPLFPV